MLNFQYWLAKVVEEFKRLKPLFARLAGLAFLFYQHLNNNKMTHILDKHFDTFG